MHPVILEQTIQKSCPKLPIVDAVIKKVEIRLKFSSENLPLYRATEHGETCTSFIFGFFQKFFCAFRTEANRIAWFRYCQPDRE